MVSRVGRLVGAVVVACVCTLGVVASSAAAAAAAPPAQTFVYTKSPETYTVPDGIHYVDIEAAGGHGGTGHKGGKGGAGILVKATYIEVTPGEQLRVVVGGNGESAVGGGKLPETGAGGWNGGGDGSRGGGGGGGFSYVQAANGAHLVVAGGGGGGANAAVGGPQPGTLNGQNGGGSLGTPQGGGGGTLTAGGYGGHNSSIFVGDGKGGFRWGGGSGGNGLLPKSSNGGGGGGGGWFGGGGGAGSEAGSGGGGGAGSSYVIPDVQVNTTPNPGVAHVTITPVASAGAVTALKVDGPSSMVAGEGYDVTVTARDQAGVRAPDYRGTIAFSSSAPGDLPGTYAFVAADHGQHTFHNLRFRKVGSVTVTATDQETSTIRGSLDGVRVVAAPLHDLTITPTRMVINRPQLFRLQGFDAFGNDLGDVTTKATVAILPEGTCVRTSENLPLCTARFFLPSDVPHVVSATVGGVRARQNVDVLRKAPAQVKLSADPERVTRGQNVTVTAKVTSDIPDVEIPTGDVTFYDGDTKLDTVPLTTGRAAATASLRVRMSTGGTHKIVAVYAGDDATTGDRDTLSYDVLPQRTTVSIVSSANPAAKGTQPGFRVFVRAQTPEGQEQISDGEVVVMADDNPRMRFFVKAGDGERAPTQFPTPLGPGEHTITADYLGSEDYTQAHTRMTQTVDGDGVATSVAVTASDAAPEYQQRITFSATVTAATGDAKPAGSVSFTVDGAPFGAPATLVDGTATSTSRDVFGDIGHHTVAATYLPAAGWAPSSGALPGGIQLNPMTTTTTITTAPQPSDAGDPVTVTAAVAGRYGGTAEGRVRWTIDGYELPNPYNVIDNKAVIELRPGFYGLGPGAHVISGVYQPYNDHTAGSSGEAHHQVGPATPTTTTLRSSDDHADFGQPVTFTAKIATSDPSDKPTGTVQFAVDGLDLGRPVELVDGEASSVPTASLAVGDHRITARYSGGRFDFAPSEAVIEHQVVSPARTSTSVISSANPWDRNTPGTDPPQYAIRVTSRGGTPTGTIRFTLDTYETQARLDDGRATIVLPPLVIYSTLGLGSHPVRVQFTSDTEAFSDSADALDQRVGR